MRLRRVGRRLGLRDPERQHALVHQPHQLRRPGPVGGHLDGGHPRSAGAACGITKDWAENHFDEVHRARDRYDTETD